MDESREAPRAPESEEPTRHLVEHLAAELGVEEHWVAALRFAKHWGRGRAVTRAEFDAALSEIQSIELA